MWCAARVCSLRRSVFSVLGLSTLVGPRIGGSGTWRAASVWSFGDNSNGALGLPAPLADAYEPTRVPSLPSDVSALSAGHYHSLAVTAAGEVWAWGRNEEGQLGRHPAAPRQWHYIEQWRQFIWSTREKHEWICDASCGIKLPFLFCFSRPWSLSCSMPDSIGRQRRGFCCVLMGMESEPSAGARRARRYPWDS